MVELHSAHCTLLRDILSDEISDTYKEINGMRPRHFNYRDDSIASLIEAADELIAASNVMFEAS